MFKKYKNETPAEKRIREKRNEIRILNAKITACWIGSAAAFLWVGFYVGSEYSKRQFVIALGEEAEKQLRAILPNE